MPRPSGHTGTVHLSHAPRSATPPGPPLGSPHPHTRSAPPPASYDPLRFCCSNPVPFPHPTPATSPFGRSPPPRPSIVPACLFTTAQSCIRQNRYGPISVYTECVELASEQGLGVRVARHISPIHTRRSRRRGCRNVWPAFRCRQPGSHGLIPAHCTAQPCYKPDLTGHRKGSQDMAKDG